ncbi:MAG: hypothetical protein HY828_02610 [Actinobacteria bacterium]|nr:hypothetical protein [Actinomycetota bacterium]
MVDNSQAAHEAIATLEFRRLISDASAGETAVEPGDTSATWTLTAAGERLFRPLRASIGEVVAELTDGLSDQALHVTSQTLAALTARANDRLAR